MAAKRKKAGSAAENLINSLLGSDAPKPGESGISDLRQKIDKAAVGTTFVLDPSDENIAHLGLESGVKAVRPSMKAKEFQQPARSTLPKPSAPKPSAPNPGHDDKDDLTISLSEALGAAHLGPDPQVRQKASTIEQPRDVNEDRTTPVAKKYDQSRTAQVSPQRVSTAMPSTGVSSSVEPLDRDAPTVIRGTSRPDPMVQRPQISGSGYTPTEAVLKQSESLRLAQGKINDLETELERLRRDSEKLSAAGETLRRRNDELLSRLEQLELDSREASKIADEEKKVLRGQLAAKDRENLELERKVEEMDTRLEANFKKVRVRERELEHRLEILKMENASLLASKDKMILELKRQIDQLTQENEYAQSRSHEVYNQFKEKQETIRRVVRALRIALTTLEGDDSVGPSKKAE